MSSQNKLKYFNLCFSIVSHVCILTSHTFCQKNGDFYIQISWHKVSHLGPWQSWHLMPIDEVWTPLQTADILLGSLETMGVPNLVLRVAACLISTSQTSYAENNNKNLKSSYFLIMLCLFARDAEDKLDQSQKTGMERENMLQRYKKDYKNLKMQFIERSKQGKR